MKFKAFPWILFLCFFLAVSPAWALIEKSPFLDADLSGLEKGNIFLERYNELRTTLTKDVPEAVDGMIEFMQSFLNSMMEGDESGASGLR